MGAVVERLPGTRPESTCCSRYPLRQDQVPGRCRKPIGGYFHSPTRPLEVYCRFLLFHCSEMPQQRARAACTMAQHILAMQASSTDSTQIWCNLRQTAAAGRGRPHAAFISPTESLIMNLDQAVTRQTALGSHHDLSLLGIRNRRPGINIFPGFIQRPVDCLDLSAGWPRHKT